MQHKEIAPTITRMEPMNIIGFKRPVWVIIIPVATADVVPARLGTRRRVPAAVADSRRTV